MNLFKAASTVSLLTLLSRITGLMRELLMASVFGASALTDAFNVAFRIPNLFRRLFAEGAFSQAFVPVLAASKEKEGEEATRRVISHVATVLSFALLITCVVGVVGAPWLVWAMASGLQQNPQGYEAAVVMTRWMFPYIAFMSLVALSAGVLNTWRRFAVPAATPVLLNLAMIAAAWLGAPWLAQRGMEPIYAMAAGVMLGGCLQLGVQIPALLSLGLLPRLRWFSGLRAAWRDSATQNIVRLMLPALLGVSVAQISLLINTQIASHLQSGSVSWLSYADRLMEFPTAMLGVALGVVLMPQLASARTSGNDQQYSDMLDWGLRLVVLLAAPCAVALLCFAQPLVATLYHYGAFSVRDVTQTSVALMGWGVGLIGVIAIKVLAPGYYARQDIKTPVRIAVVVLILTQLFNAWLVPYFAHAALSLSIGLGACINALWLLIGLMRRGSYRPTAAWGKFMAQVGLACVVLAAFLWWAGTAVDWVALRAQPLYRLGLMGATILGAAVLYLGVARASGLKLMQYVRH